MFIIILQSFNLFFSSCLVPQVFCLCFRGACQTSRTEIQTHYSNHMYNKCIYGFFFLFFSPYFWFLIHISQMDITTNGLLNTTCTISFFFLFLFNGHNRGDIQLRFKQNKHHPFEPIFFPWFFFSRQMHHCFSFIKILYSQKTKTIRRFFLFSCNSCGVGGSNQVLSAETSARILCEVGRKYFNVFTSFCFTQR